MGENTQPGKEKNTTVEQLSSLNRRQLKELEEKEKTRAQKTLEAIVMLLPILCGAVALVEYLVIPNKSRNWKPWSYVWVLGIAIAAYIIFLLYATIKSRGGEKQFYEKLHYKAPRYSALFLFLALYDYLTLKTRSSSFWDRFRHRRGSRSSWWLPVLFSAALCSSLLWAHGLQ